MIITPKLKKRKGKPFAKPFIHIYDQRSASKEEIQTDLRVKVSDWKDGAVIKSNGSAAFINGKLSAIVVELEKHYLKNDHISPRELKMWYEGPQDQPKFTPLSYFSHYIQLCKNGREDKTGELDKILNKKTKKPLTAGYIRALGVNMGYFEKLPRPPQFDRLNDAFYDSAVQNFRFQQKLKQNTIAKAVKTFGIVMQKAFDNNIHSSRNFKTSLSGEEVKRIRLSEAEVEAIINLDVSLHPTLKKEQDRFAVAYNLLLRFGDSVTINEKNIVSRNGRHFLSVVTQKTTTEVLVPLRRRTYQILQENGFTLAGTNSKSNKKLKKLGELAGEKCPSLKDEILITDYIDGEKIEALKPKYALIDTHITRRSASRHLHKRKFPLEVIMALGAWKSIDQVLEYIGIDQDIEYAADIAVEHDWFD